MRTTLRTLKSYYIIFTLSVVFVTGILGSRADAATYYISPSGSDSTSGTSASPWRSFSFATPKLRPGDTLILKNGTYGPLALNCAAGHVNGQPGQPITIKAENERQAHITSNTDTVIDIDSCTYWTIEGLRGSHPNAATGSTYIFGANKSDHITFRKNLAHSTGPYSLVSESGIELFDTTNSLVEDNEVYDFPRWGIMIKNGIYSGPLSGNNIVRRNYVNRRNWPGSVQATSCIGAYPGSDNIFENNIVVDCDSGMSTLPIAGRQNTNNKFYGNIAINTGAGFSTDFGGDATVAPSVNTLFENNVILTPRNGAAGIGGVAIGTISRQITAISTSEATSRGISVAGRRDQTGGGIPASASYRCTNCLATGWGQAGFFVDTSANPDFIFDYPAAFGNGKNFVPATSSKITNAVDLAVATAANSLGSCSVFVPASATSLKGKGKNGADIGANILYRYESTIANPGNLTNQPLWNPITGEFPGGAIVPGVNDIAGSSRFDVHKRLNVNTNGCSFPAGYGGSSPSIVRPSSPVNLTAGR